MIQLAGAFVHLQKHRLRPAAALFTLAVNNLEKYPSPHRHLDVRGVTDLASDWRQRLTTSGFAANPLIPESAPRLDEFLAVAARPSEERGIDL